MAFNLKNLVGAKVVSKETVGNSFASQQSAQALEAQVTKEGGNKELVTSGNIFIKTPGNTRDGVMMMTKGEEAPTSIEININTDSLTTATQIVIGEILPYQLVDDTFTGNPTGVVTAAGNSINYQIFLKELCSKTYVFNAIQMTITPSANATNQEAYQAQLNRNWTRYYTNGQGTAGQSPLKWSLTVDPYYFQKGIRLLQLTQTEGKFDMYSCIGVLVDPKVNIVLNMMTTFKAVIA